MCFHLPSTHPKGTLFKALAFDKGQTFLVALGLSGQKYKDEPGRALLLASRCQLRVQVWPLAGG